MYKNLKDDNFKHFIITSEGEVINTLTRHKLVGDINNCGYKRVQLYSNGKKKRYFVHRLVAEYFIQNPDNKKFVNHKDGNKLNNSIDNLEWVTQSENEVHKFRVLGAKKTVKKVKVVFPNNSIKIYNSFKDAYTELGYLQQTFSNYVKNGMNKDGYKFFIIE